MPQPCSDHPPSSSRGQHEPIQSSNASLSMQSSLATSIAQQKASCASLQVASSSTSPQFPKSAPPNETEHSGHDASEVQAICSAAHSDSEVVVCRALLNIVPCGTMSSAAAPTRCASDGAPATSPASRKTRTTMTGTSEEVLLPAMLFARFKSGAERHDGREPGLLREAKSISRLILKVRETTPMDMLRADGSRGRRPLVYFVEFGGMQCV